MGTLAYGHAGIPAGVQKDMCTHCDRTCVKERFPSIYPLAQADLAQLVEHNLAKVGVAGSSPVVRSSDYSRGQRKLVSFRLAGSSLSKQQI